MSYFLVSRGVFEHGIFDGAVYSERDAWIWMISSAAYKDTTVSILNNPVELKRGQLSHSLRFMANKFKWTKRKVECFLERLKTWDMVSIDCVTGQMIISICNYSKYQDITYKKGTDRGQPTGQTGDRQGTKKNTLIHKYKNELDINISVGFFDEFWGAYPKQRAGSKDKAFKVYQKKAEQHGEAVLLEGVKRYAVSPEVAKGYAKGCAAWLNDDRFLSSYEAPKKQQDYFDDILEAGQQAFRNVSEGR